MFNWLGTIFVLISLVLLFAAWTRAIRIKDRVKGEGVQSSWALLRILVFVAMLAEVVLAIIAIIGLRVTFAWMSALFLIYYSFVFFQLTTFFLDATEGEKKTTGS